MEEEKKGTIAAVISLSIINSPISSKPTDIQITAGNYEGEDIIYNMF